MIEYLFTFPVYIENIGINKSFVNRLKKIKLKKFEFNLNNYSIDEESIACKELNNFLQEIAEKIKLDSFKITKTWLQKYNKNNFHDCHTHDLANFSFIYYLDCTKNSSDTWFYNPLYPYYHFNQYRVKPEKGKCIVFSGAIPHAVLPNKDDKRLILSGNVNFYNE